MKTEKYTKNCTYCNKKFSTWKKVQKYCNKKCSAIRNKQRWQDAQKITDEETLQIMGMMH